MSQIAVVTAFAFVWMARPLVGAPGALVAVLIVDGLHYSPFTAAKFNHDVVQLPFWAFAGYAYHAGLKRGRMLDWLLLGVALGKAIWSKYFVVVLAVPSRCSCCSTATRERPWQRPDPIWRPPLRSSSWRRICSGSWPTISCRSLMPTPGRCTFWGPARLSDQAAEVPAVAARLSGSVAADRRAVSAPRRESSGGGHRERADAFDRRIVTLLAFGPAATVILLSLVTGRDTVPLWGYPLWLFLGLWIVLNALPARSRYHGAHCRGLGHRLCGDRSAFVAAYDVLPRYRSRYIAVLHPGDALGHELCRAAIAP